VSTAAPGSQTTPSDKDKNSCVGSEVTNSKVCKIEQVPTQTEATKTQDREPSKEPLIPSILSVKDPEKGDAELKAELTEYGERGRSALAKLNETQIAVLKAQFNEIDKDGSGIVTKDEMTKAMHKLGVYGSKESLELGVKNMFYAMSKDGTERIHEKEFIEMMAVGMTQSMSDQDIVEAFRAFDADGSGSVSHAELEVAFHSLGQNFMSDEEVAKMMRFFDSDDNGKIDLAEFTQVLKMLT